MALARGKFGVEYNPRQLEREPSGFGWVVAVIALALFVLLTWTLVRRIRTHRQEAELVSTESPIQAVDSPDEPDVNQPTLPSPESLTSLTFQTFQPLNTELSRRTPKVRNLLMRLEEAERRRDVEMAVTTIETLRDLPGSPVADLDDSLARRLGALNIRRLFNLRNAQWVKEEKVGRGDTASRIAAEHGSTFASLARLNGGKEKVERIVIGQTIYVMNHPRFNLVLHRRTRTADLSLNGKFFKRYDLQGAVKAREGSYEMPEKRRDFWSGVGTCFKPEDRLEIDTLLPKGTPILVSEL